ncbi:hypothetical protein [Hymenobacter lucidus]|uniref:DUF2157 domain-containing protein n=1 Tax=Hymenobacter lucidus TaxID=2880930 RepID=A0ABS8AS64_9BACT|nr:hypothetical protein [Hymenobacter lucidus]MCB2409055.1 hypothetical protein [Hymenobacter lucidus]
MRTKAYSEEGIFNLEVQHTAQRWGKTKLLTAEQVAAIVQAFPSEFYRRHLFIKIALFIFTWFAVSAASSLVFLAVFESGSGSGHDFEERLLLGCLLCGTLAIVLLEQLIIKNHLYRSGVDNALLYMAMGYFLVVLGCWYSITLSDSFDPEMLLERGLLWWMLLPVLAVLLVGVVRYADPFLGALSFLLYLGIVVALLLPSGLGQALLPFGLMLASALAYLLVRLLARRPDYLYYRTCLRTVKVLALAFFYLAGNYMVVREVNALLHGLNVSVQISYAPLFYLFTVGIPLAYITLGLRRHDRILLHMGLLTLGFSIFTYRFYRSVLPPEVALTLAGIILILLSGVLLRYLRPAKHGLTAEPADNPEFSVLDLESVVMAHVSEAGMKVPERGFEFGGGTSGGGGAEGRY